MMQMNARNHHGFTLIELMLTLAMSSMIIISMYTFYVAQQQNSNVQQDITSMQQDIRGALQLLSRDIRMAGFSPTASGDFGFLLYGTFSTEGGLTEAVSTSSTTLAFTSDLNGNGNVDTTATDIDNNGTIDMREMEQIAYRYNAASSSIQRYSSTTGVVEWQDIAENIDGVEFWYQLSDGTLTLAPTAAQISTVRSIRVTLLARSGFRDHEFTNTTVYTAASGASFNGGIPYNDNFRRLRLELTIQCRNTGT